MIPAPGYQAVLVCRRCGREHHVPMLAEKFEHWICFEITDEGHQCWTFNAWGQDQK